MTKIKKEKDIFIDSSIEKDALLNNLEKYFPIKANQWGSFYGRTGINRYDFDDIIKFLNKEFAAEKDSAIRSALTKNSMETLVFIKLWRAKLKKLDSECSEKFHLSENYLNQVLPWIQKKINENFSPIIKRAFEYKPEISLYDMIEECDQYH